MGSASPDQEGTATLPPCCPKGRCRAPSSHPTGSPPTGTGPQGVSPQQQWPAKPSTSSHKHFLGHSDPGAGKFFPGTTERIRYEGVRKSSASRRSILDKGNSDMQGQDLQLHPLLPSCRHPTPHRSFFHGGRDQGNATGEVKAMCAGTQPEGEQGPGGDQEAEGHCRQPPGQGLSLARHFQLPLSKAPRGEWPSQHSGRDSPRAWL